MHIETLRNDHCSNDATIPKGYDLHAEPPPACPFIQPTMRKNRIGTDPSLPFRKDLLVADVAVNRVSPGRSAVDEGLSMSGRPDRQPRFAFLLRKRRKRLKTGLS
jgi:hypothetical protein